MGLTRNDSEQVFLNINTAVQNVFIATNEGLCIQNVLHSLIPAQLCFNAQNESSCFDL